MLGEGVTMYDTVEVSPQCRCCMTATPSRLVPKFSPPRPLFSRVCLVGVFNTVSTTRAREVLWVEEEKSCLGAVAHIVGGLGAIANRVVVVQGVPEVGLALLESGNLLLEVGDGLVVVAGVSLGNVAIAGGRSAVSSSVSTHNIGHHPSQDVQDRNPEQGQKEEQAKGSDDQGRDQVDRQVGIGEEDPRGLFHLLSNNLILK